VSGAPECLVFDLRAEPCELDAREWNPRRERDPKALRGVVLHQWGCKVGTSEKARRVHGEAEALARRALAVPYNISCGATRAGVGVVAIAHPLDRYTHASDAGNADYLSIGVMGLFPFTESRRTAKHSAMSDALASAVDAALVHATCLLSQAHLPSSDAGPWSLIAHRQTINERGDHAACPGEAVIAAALRSRPVADGLLVPDPDAMLVAGYSKPWPPEWRRHLPAPRQLCVDLPVARMDD
jgi:hypothetical protein